MGFTVDIVGCLFQPSDGFPVTKFDSRLLIAVVQLTRMALMLFCLDGLSQGGWYDSSKVC